MPRLLKLNSWGDLQDTHICFELLFHFDSFLFNLVIVSNIFAYIGFCFVFLLFAFSYCIEIVDSF